MEAVDLTELIEQLEDNIDGLEEALKPVIEGPLSNVAGKLPLLDKSKLYALVTYAIESMIFSYLRLNGVNAKEHPVFRELTRVKQYFDKIKIAEFGEQKRGNLSLNKPAAERFIKHALSGNEKYDLERAEQLARERARVHIKFEQVSHKRKAPETEGIAPDANDVSSISSSSPKSAGEVQPSSPVASGHEDKQGDQQKSIGKRRKRDASNATKSPRRKKKNKNRSAPDKV